MTVWSPAEHAEAARLDARYGVHPYAGKAKLEELAHGCGAGRHAVLETEVVDKSQFLGGQHDLKSLGADVVHGETVQS